MRNMKIIIYLAILLMNLGVYVFTFGEWKKDCRKFGEENLAVPLHERIMAALIFVTYPSLIGIIALILWT